MSQTEQEFEEDDVLDWLQESGWEVKNGEDEPFIGTEYDRKFNEVVYWDVLERKIRDINQTSDEETRAIIQSIEQKISLIDGLVPSNKDATSLLRRGGTYVNDDGHDKPFDVIDFDNISNNEFVAVQQFTFKDTNPYVNRRPDVVLFVNGIPLVVVELKSVRSHSPTSEAINQIRNTYEDEIAPLFAPNLFNIVMNQNKLQYGAVGASSEHYHYWKDDGDKIVSDVESHFKDLVNHSRLLELLNRFVFFKRVKGDSEYAKIIPRHQQYYATKKILKDSKISKENGEYSQNLIVHVQGSGKTYAMMYAANILATERDYPVFIIVDEKELVNQFSGDLEKIEEISETIIDSDRDAKSGSEQLEEIVTKGTSGVVLTILHLFNELDESVRSPCPSVVFADEAHRFLDKILGSRMESTLKPFHYYGFTGTPIEKTYEQFSDGDDMYLHKYSMADAVDENAILPVDMKSRRDMLRWIVDTDEIDHQFDKEFSHMPEEEKRRHISEVVGTEELAGIESRVDVVIEDIVNHFTTELRSGDVKYKGMVVTKGKKNAAKYGIKLQEKLGEDIVDVLYSASVSDSKTVQKFHKSKEERRTVIDNFKSEDTNPQLLVVCDMLRTGFDAPILRTIYLDRRFDGGHTLLQTIARTNRTKTEDDADSISEEKLFGQIIDYQGITEEFDSLVNYDAEEIEAFTSEDKQQFKEEFEKQLSVIRQFFRQQFESNKEHAKSEWVNQLETFKVQEEYKREFKKLRTLHRNIQPDEFLVQYQDEYDWYSQIYDSVKTHHKGRTGEIQNGMVDAVKSGVEVQRKEQYVETGKVVGHTDSEPLEVAKKKATLEEIMHKNQRFDSRYETLSERIEDIINRWNQDVLTADDALVKLEEVESEALELKEEIENSDLDKCERALKSVMVQYEIEDEQAEEIAKNIVERFESDPPSTRFWWKSQEKLDYVRKIINDELYPCLEVLLETDIETQLLKYLVQIKRTE